MTWDDFIVKSDDYETITNYYDQAVSNSTVVIKNGEYIKGYIKTTTPKQNAMNSITNVIFNNPATIVFWSDGTKTVVKCDERDEFDPEKGLAMAICKKHFGGGFYNDIFKKWIPKEKTPEIEIDGQITMDDIAEKFEKLAKAAKSMFGPWDD